jgi:hypothetical protein
MMLVPCRKSKKVMSTSGAVFNSGLRIDGFFRSLLEECRHISTVRNQIWVGIPVALPSDCERCEERNDIEDSSNVNNSSRISFAANGAQDLAASGQQGPRALKRSEQGFSIRIGKHLRAAAFSRSLTQLLNSSDGAGERTPQCESVCHITKLDRGLELIRVSKLPSWALTKDDSRISRCSRSGPIYNRIEKRIQRLLWPCTAKYVDFRCAKQHRVT